MSFFNSFQGKCIAQDYTFLLSESINSNITQLQHQNQRIGNLSLNSKKSLATFSNAYHWAIEYEACHIFLLINALLN